jgi:hypothetical protein
MSNSSYIFDCDEKRKNLEAEASAITDELTKSIDGKEPMGVSTPLVDKEGYPRADIDVYRARHLRKRLNEIRFDHAAIMKKIEENVSQHVSGFFVWIPSSHFSHSLCTVPVL